MDPELLALAHRTRGFMPDDEGLALYTAALAAARLGPIVEIGTYCGKSSIYLAAAARAHGTLLFTIDHHRGSEENQPGEQYHDPALADPLTGGLDSLPAFRRTMTRANLDDCLIAIIGRSEQLAAILRPTDLDQKLASEAHGDASMGRERVSLDVLVHDVEQTLCLVPLAAPDEDGFTEEKSETLVDGMTQRRLVGHHLARDRYGAIRVAAEP